MKYTSKHTFLILTLIFIITFCIFYIIGNANYQTDLSLHNIAILKLNNNESIISPHFLYFSLVSLFTFYNNNISNIIIFASAILAFSICLKYYITVNIFNDYFKDKFKTNTSLFLTISTGLLLLTNMPCKPFWTSELPPISWHNSTSIFAFPFSILLFWDSFKFIENQSNNLLKRIIILSAIITLIKPNFTIVFGVVFPLFYILTNGLSISTFKKLIWLVIPLLIILGQYYYTFTVVNSNNNNEFYNDVKVFIDPFHAWHKISKNILFSWLSWALYPISFVLLYFNKIKDDLLYKYAAAFYLVGMFIFILLTEKRANGNNIGAVNFLWQTIICHYLLFFISVIKQTQFIYERKKIESKDYFLMLIGFYFVFSGIMYLLRTVFIPFLLN